MFWRSSRDTRCLRSTFAFSSSVRSSNGFSGVPGVPDKGRALKAGLDEASPDGPAKNCGPILGVPEGVALDRGGILAGGGVPLYCARRKRALGEAEMAVPKLGVPNVGGVPSGIAACSRRGLGMSNGLEGEDIVVREQGAVRTRNVAVLSSLFLRRLTLLFWPQTPDTTARGRCYRQKRKPMSPS